MKFDEFPLYNSIFDIYRDFENNNLKPRSADWLIFKTKREELSSLVIDNIRLEAEASRTVFSCFSEEQILKAWDDFGKNKSKYNLIIPVARQYGCECFYKHRNRGKCSRIMGIERLQDQRHNSAQLENCVIVCKKHNTDKK